MDLNKRQLQILVVLRNKNHWITSEELAEALGTNKKTIQTEIKKYACYLREENHYPVK